MRAGIREGGEEKSEEEDGHDIEIEPAGAREFWWRGGGEVRERGICIYPLLY